MGSQCSNPILTNSPTKKSLTTRPPSHRTENSSVSCKDLEHFHDLLSQISHHEWIEKEHQLVNSEKFFAEYKEYLREQVLLNEIWEYATDENDSHPDKNSHSHHPQPIAPHLKLLIRAGIPLDKLRHVVLDIFERNSYSANIEYECASKVAFADHIPETFKNVPLFSYSNEIEEVLPVHYLNEEGIMALKRIMWVFDKNIPRLEYCPILSQVVSLLLVFMTESEGYCVVKEMIDRSQNLIEDKENIKTLKWYFTMKKEEYEVFLESQCIYMRAHRSGFRGLWKHLQGKHYDCNQLFWELCKTLFLGILPLPLALRIFMAYLNEGIKIYYRFCLAILKMYEKDILACNNMEAVFPLLKEKCRKMTKDEFDNLLSTAYTTLKFRSFKRKLPSIHPESFHAPESKKLYLPVPVMSSPSNTFKSQEFETLWEWLPVHLKRTRPQLKYSSKVHGWSLNTLYSCCTEDSEIEYEGILIFIRTTEDVLFGAFIEGMIEGCTTTVLGENDDSFVFQLEPEEIKYNATGKNNICLICEKEALTVGAGGKGPAIYLTNNLLNGYSFCSDTYLNDKPIHMAGKGDDKEREGEGKGNNQFECNVVEVYWLTY